MILDLSSDPAALTQAICDIHSVSHQEGELADAVEAALGELPHLSISRRGHTVIARTQLGRERRVVLAGHLDTVPLTDPPNLPSRLEVREGEQVLWGRGSVDMKGGVAAMLAVAARVPEPTSDLTFIFYEAEEVASIYNGLAILAQQDPAALACDFAILLEPTCANVEGGCKGTLRVEIATTGTAAHSARPWRGKNAIHAAAEVLTRLSAYDQATVEVDGLEYHEALQAVNISGGIAGNVIPDACTITVNYRFAPNKSEAEALEHVRSIFSDLGTITLTDSAPGARPGLESGPAADFVASLGVPVGPKEGWTDVARFSALGIPALNFGPGDPALAHQDDEHCPTSQIRLVADRLVAWLSAPATPTTATPTTAPKDNASQNAARPAPSTD